MYALMFEWSELGNMESRVDDDNSASNYVRFTGLYYYPRGLEVELMHALMFEWSELGNISY